MLITPNQMYTHTHKHTHTLTHTYTHMHTQTRACTHKHTYIHKSHKHTHTHTNTHTQTRAYTHTHTNTCTHSDIHTQTHTHAHIRTQAHKHTQAHTHTSTHTHLSVHQVDTLHQNSAVLRKPTSPALNKPKEKGGAASPEPSHLPRYEALDRSWLFERAQLLTHAWNFLAVEHSASCYAVQMRVDQKTSESYWKSYSKNDYCYRKRLAGARTRMPCADSPCITRTTFCV